MFAALDLGTNNCRLLIAAKERGGFRVVDAFSRIVRLGEGLSRTGRLSDAAMDRAVAALDVCAQKIEKRGVAKVRCVATAACRTAENGPEFADRVAAETGLNLEIITPEREARLAARGCADLIDRECERALVFDIGGGSTELSWVRPRFTPKGAPTRPPAVEAWTSLPVGVVTLCDRFGDLDLEDAYEALRERTAEDVRAFDREHDISGAFKSGCAHLLGTSGTVTSIGGVFLDLERYDRKRVDGLWLSRDAAAETIAKLRRMSIAERREQPCVGQERADLLLAGCAVVEAIFDVWPADRLRVADRGLREGILLGLMQRRRRARSRGARSRK